MTKQEEVLKLLSEVVAKINDKNKGGVKERVGVSDEVSFVLNPQPREGAKKE